MSEPIIDPNTYTIPELLKILRNELISLKEEISTLKTKLDDKTNQTEMKILSLTSRIEQIEKILSMTEGNKQGVDASMKFVVWLVAIITTIASVVSVYYAVKGG